MRVSKTHSGFIRFTYVNLFQKKTSRLNAHYNYVLALHNAKSPPSTFGWKAADAIYRISYSVSREFRPSSLGRCLPPYARQNSRQATKGHSRGQRHSGVG